MVEKFDWLCEQLNIKISTEKNVQPTQIATIYGYEWNTNKGTIGIPMEKYRNLIKFLKAAIYYKNMTGRAVESLIGKLMHYSQLHKPAKPLCYNAIAYIHKYYTQKLQSSWLCIFSYGFCL